jgi:adenylate cyclase class 2
MIETEIKLVFADVEAARRAVTGAGGRLTIARRLLDDRLFDTPDSTLQQSGRALRVRRDGHGGFLTFKGPIHAGPLKAREETETAVGEPAKIEAVLESLGYACRFRAQKYREEYVIDDATLAIDETPMGVYVEVEGPAAAIQRIAEALGRSPADYRVESYSMLWQTWRAEQDIDERDMTFGDEGH